MRASPARRAFYFFYARSAGGCRLAFQTPCQFRAASCDRFAARLRLGQPDAYGAGEFSPITRPSPAPAGGCRESYPRCTLACAFPIGRGSPFKVVASAANMCFASCADNSARSGATRAAKPPKTERGSLETHYGTSFKSTLGRGELHHGRHAPRGRRFRLLFRRLIGFAEMRGETAAESRPWRFLI